MPFLVTSVMYNTLQHFGLQPARLLCLRGSPGKNTGISCHALLQGIFPHLLYLLHWQVGSLPLVPPGKPHIQQCVYVNPKFPFCLFYQSLMVILQRRESGINPLVDQQVKGLEDACFQVTEKMIGNAGSHNQPVSSLSTEKGKEAWSLAQGHTQITLGIEMHGKVVSGLPQWSNG